MICAGSFRGRGSWRGRVSLIACSLGWRSGVLESGVMVRVGGEGGVPCNIRTLSFVGAGAGAEEPFADIVLRLFAEVGKGCCAVMRERLGLETPGLREWSSRSHLCAAGGVRRIGGVLSVQSERAVVQG